jgi:hypothetical protein
MTEESGFDSLQRQELSSLQLVDRLWGLPRLLSIGCERSLPFGEAALA